MGKVDCISLPGLSLWFNSNDHRPPHFHAEKADRWEVSVRFLMEAADMITVEWGDGPSGKERKALIRLAEEYRFELLVEWERKVNPRDPGPER